jgi:hypothetical protein
MKRLLLLLVLILLLACASGGGDAADSGPNGGDTPEDAPTADEAWYQPTAGTTWQWQLSGSLNSGYDAVIYDVDLFETSADLIKDLQTQGRKVICYFSAGSFENWRPDADQFSQDTLGSDLDGWPGERWLDIRSTDVAAVMSQRLDLAVQKGCDGVEPDNVDGYANASGFDLSAADQLAYNRWLAVEAHNRELAIGLKNDLDQIVDLVDDFDFAVNEQCFQYDECDLVAPFIDQGKAVLQAEYRQIYVDDATARESLCQDARTRQFSTLILPLDLDDAFRYSCE